MPSLSLGLGLHKNRIFAASGGGNPFSPSDLSGLSMWLKADAGVTLSGLNVTAWADQSGNGRNATPVDVSPTFNASELNNKPTISLSSISGGTNKSLQISGNPMGESGSTAFVVNYVDKNIFNSDNNGALLGNFGNASDGSHWPFGPENSVYDSFATDSRKNNLGIPEGILNWNIYSVFSEDNNWKLFCNGNEFYSDSENVYSTSIANSTSLYVGMQNNAGSNQVFKGKVAEVVIYNRVLTSTERQQVEQYLFNKYAISTADVSTSNTSVFVAKYADSNSTGTYDKKTNGQDVIINSAGHTAQVGSGFCYRLGGNGDARLLVSPSTVVNDAEVGDLFGTPIGTWALIDAFFDGENDAWYYEIKSTNPSTNINYIPISGWSTNMTVGVIL